MRYFSQLTYLQWKRSLLIALLLLDTFMLILAMGLAAFIRFRDISPAVAFEANKVEAFYPQLFPILLAIWLILFFAYQLYDFDSLFWGSGEFTRVGSSITLGLVGLIVTTFALKLHGISRTWMILAWILGLTFVILGRLVFRGFIVWLRKKGYMNSRTLIIGSNEEAKLLLERAKNKASGLLPIGFLSGKFSESSQIDGIPKIGDYTELPEAIKKYGIECALISSSDFGHKDVNSIVKTLHTLPVDIHISSGLFEIITSRVLIKEIGGVPLMTVRRIPLTTTNYFKKRFLDLFVSVMGLIFLMPLWVILAFIIKLTSRGPVLYRQLRIGKHKKPFVMYKFRSMILGAEEKLDEIAHLNAVEGLHFKVPKDPRITHVGHWMRKYSIDEFPQLINVIIGNMSLVGPRPPLPEEAEKYNDWYCRRLEVQPGMTGLWQVSGRSELSFDEAVKLDVFYIENWSPRLDLSIIARTLPVVMTGRGAY